MCKTSGREGFLCEVYLSWSIAAPSSQALLRRAIFSAWQGKGRLLLPEESTAWSMQEETGQLALSETIIPPVFLTQNNQHINLAYFGMAHPSKASWVLDSGLRILCI